MSEQQQEAGQVPNVHENAVTGIAQEPVQGATSTGSGFPETVDHPTSGDPDATPDEVSDVTDGGTQEADADGYDSADTHAEAADPSQSPAEAAQGDAGGSVDSGTAAPE